MHPTALPNSDCGATSRYGLVAWLARFAVVLAAMSTGSARAAPTAVPPYVVAAAPMAVRIVHSSDVQCGSNRCSDWIALDGPIGPGSAARFARAVQALGARRLPVLISSPGGLVSEAMALGRLIRAKHMDVAVMRTAVVSCPADRDACRTMTPDGLVLGFPDARRSICASACPLVLAGGTRRFVGPWAMVGVHQYVGFIKEMKVMRRFRVMTRTVDGVRREVSRTLISETPLPDTARMVRKEPHYGDTAAYFGRMGVTEGIMPLMKSAPSTGIYWLTRDELLATRMATDVAGGESLIEREQTAPVAPKAIPVPAMPSVATADPSGAVQPRALPSPREIAALIDDAGVAIRLTPGSVVWSVSRDAGTDGSADLVANVALDDDAGSLTFRIAKARDRTGHLGERLRVLMLPGNHSPFGQILAVETPGLRKDAHALPDPFVGRVDAAPPAAFSMTLSDTAQDVARDMALLASDQWIDVPIMIDAAKTVRLTFALGTSGARAVREWQGTQMAGAAR